MGIIDNPFGDKWMDDLGRASKSERGKSNAHAIANAVDISAENGEAKEWIVNTYNSGSDLKEYDYIGDGISEVADGAVPVYYFELWKVFVGVRGWTEGDYLEEAGYEASFDINKMAQIILSGIAERILQQYVSDNDLED